MARVFTNRKSGFIQRSGAMRRETLWIGGSFLNTTLGTANTANLLTSLNAAALALRPFTVVRTRGYWQIRSDQIGATELLQAAYGQCVVSDEAVAIGVTAIPTPSTDNNSDLWFVYEAAGAAFQFNSGVGVENWAGSAPLAIDSKAMRKVEDGQDLVEVIENSPLSDGVTIQTFTRTLVKLH